MKMNQQNLLPQLKKKSNMEPLNKIVTQGYTTQIDRFLSSLFECRDTLHFSHLKAEKFSHAQHLHLEEAYTLMLPILDLIVEGYTGLYIAPKLNVDPLRIADSALLDYVKNTYDSIKDARGLFVDDWIKSKLDEISQIFALLLYKLKYLK